MPVGGRAEGDVVAHPFAGCVPRGGDKRATVDYDFGFGMRRRTRLRLCVVAAVLATLVVAAASPARSPGALPQDRAPFVVPEATAIVAVARGATLAVYGSPGASSALKLLHRSSSGAPLVVLVRNRNRMWAWPEWVEAYLPVRPNGSTGWIRASDVTFALDPFDVRIELARHLLTVSRAGRPFFRAAIGVGRAVTPTPTGTYFLTELLETDDPAGLYGPFVFVTSAYSPVLLSFGGGPGQVGIHGTDYPAGIGTDVSHGCIRMSNANIRRLAAILPLGTPVRIVR
jgi:lipoprotein-anchoring transpeptidase ErfK/SrfK